MSESCLIIDDDRTVRRMLATFLKSRFDFRVVEAENGKEALDVLKNNPDIRLVVMDLDMPVMDGRETLKQVRRDYDSMPVIVLTGSKNMDDAVQAMKGGAYDFLCKPIEVERLNVSVRNALKSVLMATEITKLKKQANQNFSFSNLIGHDVGLIDTVKSGQKASVCDLAVLITGETGTGKEMFSKAIHGQSSRSSQPFIAVNCGALPENLIESTLFGHEKGSFTGAIAKSLGKFQEANNGTIFLDEVGELPLGAQVKLLRVLQQQEVEPVGAGKPVPINVRIVSATHRDLSEDVKEGRFREDLYFRLNVLHIDLPALKQRKADIFNLSHYFIEQFCSNHAMPQKKLSKSALLKLQNYHWPGNVRELENAIHRALAMAETPTLDEDDFVFLSAGQSAIAQDGVIYPVDGDGCFKSYKDLEKEIMTLAVAHHGHNISKTARVLGIAKSTLYSKIETAKDLSNL